MNKNSSSITLKPRRELVIEELQTELDRQLEKIALINDFMALHCTKSQIKEDLTLLRTKTGELKRFVSVARDKIEMFKSVQVAQSQLLIESMRKQHLKMLEMLDRMDNTSDKDSVTSTTNGTTSIVSLFGK